MAQESGTSSYTMGYSEEFLQLLGRRSAKTHASQFGEWRRGLDEWKSHPGACGAFAFGEVVALKQRP